MATANEPFDLDEDLFDFEELSAASASEDEACDLDEIFASFAVEDGSEPASLAHDAPAGATDADADADAGDLSMGGEPPVPRSGSRVTSPTPRASARAASAESVAPRAPSTKPAPATTAAPTTDASRDAVGAPPPAPAPRASLSKSLVMILVAVCGINGLIAIVMLKSTGDMHDRIIEASRRVQETSAEIREDAWQRADEYNQVAIPLVPPNPENHPTFDLVRADIEASEFAQARQRLYSLLSIIDRLDPEERDRVERRANYMLGHALHLEAVTRLETER